ncbi:hypothetical protein F5Y12DRAFT_725242 [Xylaria sp. FL1777]|nr:hypothetical protein F5Y12DRAFT_725242 [Xylaria sp. FL1777]
MTWSALSGRETLYISPYIVMSYSISLSSSHWVSIHIVSLHFNDAVGSSIGIIFFSFSFLSFFFSPPSLRLSSSTPACLVAAWEKQPIAIPL